MSSARIVAAAAFALVALSSTAARAQFPGDNPIMVIVPYAAGGPTDTVARILSESLSRQLGQRVLVENVAGAGGTIGSQQVARSAPDGHTLLLNHIGQATAKPLYPQIAYDPVSSFEPIGQIADVPMTVIGSPGFSPSTIEELVSYLKENGETVTYANAGPGTASYLCGRLLMDTLDVQMTEVPYQGTGPAMADILGSQVDLMCDQTTNTSSYLLAGQIKPFVTTTRERLANLPDIPSAPEAGLDELDLQIWHGLYAPSDTSPEIVEKLGTALAAAMQDEALLQRFTELGAVPATGEAVTSAGLAGRVWEESERWSRLLDGTQ